MLTYEEALEKARIVKPRINYCVEYTSAYSFGFDVDNNTEGGDAPVVIMKDDGRVMNQLDYAITPNKEIIRTFDIDTGKPKATMLNVSRFDDDGFGIHNLTRLGEPYQENGPEGVDRWTSNGHGLVMEEPNITPEQAKEIDTAADQATQTSDSL